MQYALFTLTHSDTNYLFLEKIKGKLYYIVFEKIFNLFYLCLTIIIIALVSVQRRGGPGAEAGGQHGGGAVLHDGGQDEGGGVQLQLRGGGPHHPHEVAHADQGQEHRGPVLPAR